MDDKLPTICIVCIANYCRSPVAESLLREKLINRYNVISAGVSPMPAADMDQRSRIYLESIGFKNFIHNPRMITNNIINNSKYIFAMDIEVLTILNKKYKRQSDKIMLFSYKDPSVDLSDPYRMKSEEYNIIMNNISKVSEEFLV